MRHRAGQERRVLTWEGDEERDGSRHDVLLVVVVVVSIASSAVPTVCAFLVLRMLGSPDTWPLAITMSFAPLFFHLSRASSWAAVDRSWTALQEEVSWRQLRVWLSLSISMALGFIAQHITENGLTDSRPIAGQLGHVAMAAVTLGTFVLCLWVSGWTRDSWAVRTE